MTRKILYSPGYGAGWTTWAYDPEVKALMLTYAPIVEHLETNQGPLLETSPAVQRFIVDVEALGKAVPYLGGLRDLTVATVNGPVRITEYDGVESYETPDSIDWL